MLKYEREKQKTNRIEPVRGHMYKSSNKSESDYITYIKTNALMQIFVQNKI